MVTTYTSIWKSVFRDASTLPQEEVVKLFEQADDIIIDIVSSFSNSKTVLETLSEILWSVGGSLHHGKTIFERVAVPKDQQHKPSKVIKQSIKKLSFNPPIESVYWHKSRVDNESIVFLQQMSVFAALSLKGHKHSSESLKKMKLVRVTYEQIIRNFLQITSTYIEDCLTVAKFESVLDDIRSDALFDMVSDRIFSLRSKIWAVESRVGLSSIEGLFQTVLDVRQKWLTYEALRNKIAIPYLRIVFDASKQRSNSEEQTLENFQNGAIAVLTSGVSKYSANRGVFSSYVSQWSQQGVLAGLKDSANFIKLPPATWQIWAKINRTRELLSAKNPDGTCTNEQIAKEMGLELDKVESVTDLVKLTQLLSIDYETGDDPDAQSLHDTVEDHPQDLPPEISAFISQLDGQSRKFLLLNYGLFDHLDGSLPKDPAVVALEKLRQRIAQSM